MARLIVSMLMLAGARYVAFTRDITGRRMAEQSLKGAKKRAEDVSRAKVQFLEQDPQKWKPLLR
jgi:hypothetical protein